MYKNRNKDRNQVTGGGKVEKVEPQGESTVATACSETEGDDIIHQIQWSTVAEDVRLHQPEVPSDKQGLYTCGKLSL